MNITEFRKQLEKLEKEKPDMEIPSHIIKELVNTELNQ